MNLYPCVAATVGLVSVCTLNTDVIKSEFSYFMTSVLAWCDVLLIKYQYLIKRLNICLSGARKN